MENSEVFTYQYSAVRNQEVARIRQKYLPPEEDKLETLKRLDRHVRTAGQIQALTVGVLGVLLFGVGMCFGLDVWNAAGWLTYLFAAVGTAVMLPAYPLYKTLSRRTRERLTPEILRLSEELLAEPRG